ncbi:ferredoxin-dependent glutamate synthase chloroplastic [Phtheirospermum japonicum]|uniref:Ferredoxin-dependent glutamate synthase chloroplastic n=1 Tax=Phtheirospermum japonicum TaxID=374723 RepID=A0A830BHA7_9LAMI|nr:ferredoxin-dependent glutamate synthase chloroplastic [Phtheirospermum japonicum]
MLSSHIAMDELFDLDMALTMPEDEMMSQSARHMVDEMPTVVVGGGRDCSVCLEGFGGAGKQVPCGHVITLDNFGKFYILILVLVLSIGFELMEDFKAAQMTLRNPLFDVVGNMKSALWETQKHLTLRILIWLLSNIPGLYGITGEIKKKSGKGRAIGVGVGKYLE